MNKVKLLNWMGGAWFLLNIPLIPFTGSVINGIFGNHFSSTNSFIVVLNFVVLVILIALNKTWNGKYFSIIPIGLAFAVFILALTTLLFGN